MTATIDNKLYAYIGQLNLAWKKSLLQFIKTIIAPAEHELSISIEDYNKELAEAEEAIDRGEFYTNDQVFNKVAAIINEYK